MALHVRHRVRRVLVMNGYFFFDTKEQLGISKNDILPYSKVKRKFKPNSMNTWTLAYVLLYGDANLTLVSPGEPGTRATGLPAHAIG